MEIKILEYVSDALQDIGYHGPLLEPEELSKAIEGGPKSVEYTNLVHAIAEELQKLCSLEETVHAIQSPDDASSFLLELSSFLKEIGCPYISLTTGHLSSRLQLSSDKLLLLEFLLSELMGARIMSIKKIQEVDTTMEVTIHETETAKDLKDILLTFQFNKPPPNVTSEIIFSKIEGKIKEKIQKEGPNYVGRPLYNKALTEKQWKEIEVLYKKLSEEYKMRREMLITRLDCTIQSFEWSGQGNKKHEEIQSVYRPLRSSLKIPSSIKLSDFLAARNTLLTLKKTSDASVRVNTKSQVNKVIIGRVPDRGGRPSEQEPPPPEMPSWQQQRTPGGGGAGRGGGSGFGGGSKVQGNWNSGSQGGDYRGGSSVNRNERNQGFQDRNYQDNNYQDNRYNQNQGYQNQRNQNQGYQNQRNQNQGNQNQGYHNQGYHGQNYRNDYQQDYQDQNRGYQSHQSHQGRGKYQNEHDDRSNNYDKNPGRGRSNYNRGGRR